MTALTEFADRYAAAWSSQDPVAFAAFYPDMVVRLVDLRGYEQWIPDEDGLILECHGHMDDAEYQRQLITERMK